MIGMTVDLTRAVITYPRVGTLPHPNCTKDSTVTVRVTVNATDTSLIESSELWKCEACDLHMETPWVRHDRLVEALAQLTVEPGESIDDLAALMTRNMHESWNTLPNRLA